MSEAGDFDPGPWRGHDFASARKVYDRHVGRSYDDAIAVGKNRDDLVPKSIKTNSESPLVIACDVTGSMGDWPATMFSKLPYLELEGKEYLGEGMEISFAAIGDAYSDKYPLQVREFTSEKGLEKSLKELVIEGNGGGQCQESYDLAALYYARNVQMPKAINKPIFIFIGDEGLYDSVDKGHAKEWARVSLEKRMTSRQAIEELQEKFSVYLVRKPYHVDRGNSMSSTDEIINKQWTDYLGVDHVAILPEAGRVVDVIFGVLAKETDRIKYFEDELRGRQRDDQVKTVLKSLHTVHKLPRKSMPKLPEGVSITRRSGKAGTAKPLI